jgi:hypothetical protein
MYDTHKEKVNAYRILEGILKERGKLGRHKPSWEDNTKTNVK